MIYIEIIVLLISVIAFLIQVNARKNNDILSKKIVYWTLMLFVSIFLNTILYMKYINNYSMEKYFTITTIVFLVGILLGYGVIQLISPFKYIKYSVNKYIKNGKKAVVYDISEEDEKTKQGLFEIFLETICWISFSLALLIDILLNFIKSNIVEELIANNFSVLLCALLFVTIPICIRQTLYYIINIRKMKVKIIPEKYNNLNILLSKNNVKL